MNIYEEAIIVLNNQKMMRKKIILKALERAKKVEELCQYYKYKSQAYRSDIDVVEDIAQIEWNIVRLEKELEEMK